MAINSWVFLICFQILVLSGTAGYPQPPRFRHYSTDDGFTGSAFKEITQDSLGFLWISSGGGLFRFDGYDFVNYKSARGDTLGFPMENPLMSIWADPVGSIWVGFPDNFAYYDRNQDGFIRYKVPTGGLKPEAVWFESPKVLWIATQGTGLVRFDATAGTYSIHFNKYADARLAKARNTIRDLIDQGPFLLLGTDQGLWRFDKRAKRFSRPICDPADSSRLYQGKIQKIFRQGNSHWLWMDQEIVRLTSNFSLENSVKFGTIWEKIDREGRTLRVTVQHMAIDENEQFWMATQGLGLICVDPYTGSISNYRNNEQDENSLPSDVLNQVFVDRNKNVWATTVNKGIALLKKQSLAFNNYMVGSSVTGMTFLHAQERTQLIVATNGNGIWTCWFDPRAMAQLQFEKFEPSPPIKGLESTLKLFYDEEYLWAGTLNAGVIGFRKNANTGLLNRQPAVTLRHDPENMNTIGGDFVLSLWRDKFGRLWVGGYDKGMSIVNMGEYGKPGSVVRIVHDTTRHGSLAHDGIVGTVPDGADKLLLATFDGLDRVLSGIKTSDQEFEHLLSGISVNKIYRTFNGNLLLCTKTGLYEGVSNGDRYSFSKLELPGNPFLTAVEEDRLERLWLQSFEGMFLYDRRQNTTVLFRKEDGLPSSGGVPAGTALQSPEGIMIFGTAEGLAVFDPMAFQINKVNPRPLITGLRINNREVKSSQKGEKQEYTISQNINTIPKLVLNHQQNILTLEFAAMDFTAPERNYYMHRLDGLEEGWVRSDWKNRTATYTNLAPGDYTFRVKASNRDGVLSSYERTLQITVLPPPWKTWWAYSLYGLTLAVLLIAARRSIINQERLNSRLRLEHFQLEKAREMDRAKSIFFTNISHEFRTPLTLIQGPVQMLREQLAGNRKAKEKLDLIDGNTTQLLRLVNQLLDLARLESGKAEIENLDTDLDVFLGSVVNSFKSQALQKDIKIVINPPVEAHSILLDKPKVETILINLIGNAIKFTPPGGVVSVSATVEPANSNAEQDRLRVIVSDTGIGIPQEMQELVFDRFYQVNQSHKEIGTGIGLALVKELTELLNGAVTLKSDPGKGSEFAIIIPTRLVRSTEAAITRNGDEVGGKEQLIFDEVLEPFEGKCPRILVVEDHVELRKFIISAFGNKYDFIEAGDGDEGFRKAVQEIPELIISDVMMPGMDGITMTGKIKHDIRSSHIPIILLTAKATEESKIDGLTTGADDYVTKPFNKDELILKVKNLIDSRAKIREKVRLELLKEAPKINAQSADEKFLLRVKEAVMNHLGDEQLGVEVVAREVGLSRSQLYRKITALTGISMNELIRNFRLQKAGQLLASEWGSVSQIAFEVGFSNMSYFTKCFKDHFGTVPSDYHPKD
jgi:signal transduction histidine kinase/DNA-binding response OmpR family regulator/ligand-binding sensor domain-containing protein